MKLMTNWQQIKLGEICDVRDGTHDTPKESPEGKYLVTSKHIKGGKIDLSAAYKISIDDFNFVNQRSKVDKWDILISMIGTVGEICLVSEIPDFAIKNVGLIKTGNEHLAKYLYYYLKSPTAQNDILSRLKGTTQQYLSLGEIRNFPIIIPPLDIQKKIAGVLSALDDKIELNNKINNNLEQQAQALFKSWFVDFEPFGGVMPRDWKETYLSDIAIFANGYSYKGSELQHSPMAMATIKNFDRNGGFKLEGFKEIVPSSKLKSSQYVEVFDALVAHTDLTQNADVIGNAEMLMSKANYQQVIISMDIVKVLPKNGISQFLLAALLKDIRFKKHCLGYINGTTVLHLSKKALPEYNFRFPQNIQTVENLSMIFENIYRKIALNIEENTRLAALRDTLLPKLMKGEIDVSKVDISSQISTDKLSLKQDDSAK